MDLVFVDADRQPVSKGQLRARRVLGPFLESLRKVAAEITTFVHGICYSSFFQVCSRSGRDVTAWDEKFSQRLEWGKYACQVCGNVFDDFFDLGHIVDGVAELFDAGKGKGGDADGGGGDAERIHLKCYAYRLEEVFYRDVKDTVKGGVSINCEAEKRHNLASTTRLSASSPDLRVLYRSSRLLHVRRA
jgi:hypothetical protein